MTLSIQDVDDIIEKAKRTGGGLDYVKSQFLKRLENCNNITDSDRIDFIAENFYRLGFNPHLGTWNMSYVDDKRRFNSIRDVIDARIADLRSHNINRYKE